MGSPLDDASWPRAGGKLVTHALLTTRQSQAIQGSGTGVLPAGFHRSGSYPIGEVSATHVRVQGWGSPCMQREHAASRVHQPVRRRP
jgi:hypothetical protein